MYKKTIILVMFLFLTAGVLTSCTKFDGEGTTSTTKKLDKPKLVTQKYVVCNSKMNPRILLETMEKDVSIYYRIETADKKISPWAEYKEGIELKQEEYGGNYGFTIKAIAKKEGFEDSDELVQSYYYTMPSGEHSAIGGKVNFKVDTLKAGDEVVKGIFTDEKELSKQMKMYIHFKVTDTEKQKTKYKTKIKNGKFEIKLQVPLQKGDKVWLSMDTSSKIVCYEKFYNDDNVGYDTITLYEEYYFGFPYTYLYPATIS